MSDAKQTFAWAATALVVIVVGAGLYVAGSPKEARLYQQDERRVEALQQAAYAVQAFYEAHKQVPSLDSLMGRQPNDSAWFRDLVSGKPYEYEVLTSTTYRLCAEFSRPSDGGRGNWQYDWKHAAGHECFERNVQGTSVTRTGP